MPIQINGINHFAISVPDLNETVSWYQRILGFEMDYEDEIPAIGARIGHMKGPGCMLEIFQVQGAKPLPEERKMPNSDIMTHGNKHLSFGVEDGPAAKAEMEAMGVEVVFVAQVNNTYGFFIHDNSNNLIEIFEEGPRSA